MKKKIPFNYVRTERLRWAFTQEDIASLLGFEDRSCVSRLEQGERVPSLENALAFELLFGVAPRNMFPQIYTEVEEEVMRKAYLLYEATPQSSSSRKERKRQGLELTLKRATEDGNARGV